jgi:hypothetical protein
MQKPVSAVIASARGLMRMPSEAKLEPAIIKLQLHQLLEELHAMCIKGNADFYTHDLAIDLTYNSETHGYTFEIDINPGGSELLVTDVIPVFLLFQKTTSDPDSDSWSRVNISKLTTFGRTFSGGNVQAAFLGNSWQGVTSPQFKFNVDSSFITDHRWRIACRVFPQSELSMTSVVPFMPEHTTLVEVMLAIRCFPLVFDDSPSWRSFMSTQLPSLMKREAEGKAALLEWVGMNVENRVITNPMYHYRLNNPQAGNSGRRPRTEWP